MRHTKKLTLGAMIIALSVLFMMLGYFVEALDLTVAAILSLLMAFVFIELGSPYTYSVWLATSLLGAVFFTGSQVWLTYFLIFGIYPVLKAYIERLPRAAWIFVKLGFFNVALVLLMLATELILMIPFFSELPEAMAAYEFFIKAGFVAVFNLAFLLYDVFMTVMIRAYFQRLRHRVRRFLK